MVTRRIAGVCSGLTAIGIIACGSDSNLVGPIGKNGDITIEITRSSAPDFSWKSKVAVSAISVSNFRSDGTVDRILWGYRNISATPPITYGSVIAGGKNLVVGSAPPLQVGTRYRVEVIYNGAVSSADWIVP